MTMNRLRYFFALPTVLLASSCGSLPDFMEEAVRDSAKAAINEQVEEMISQLTADLLPEIDLASMMAGEDQEEAQD